MSALTPLEAAALSPQARQLLAAMQAAAPGASGVAPSASETAGTFGALVSQGLSQVNDQLIAGQQELQRLALGEGGSLHRMMIHMEESRISFQLLMQVRSRLLEAYQDVMKMPL
ncbi:flagellar hook-basal body complex protein FliE [Xenophilus sp.]|uniref:flagellar hook-basal body complex protein FliE n=1 Tax=Xenophilus sp. TaxID=1873499 RepID=UPI0037DCB5F2